MLCQMRRGLIFNSERALIAYVNIVLRLEMWALYGLPLQMSN
jgi:hypothetical protein